MVENDDNKFLLVKSRRGWEFPGGYIDEMEAIENAAIREVKEESGIVIEIDHFLGVEQDILRQTIVFLFKGKSIDGKLSTSSETKDVGYFSYEDAVELISADHFVERFNRCLKGDVTLYTR